jgi:capsular exopolysaccharide synthesis family protein
MSKFFEALEQAERDRALREQATNRTPLPGPAAAPTATGGTGTPGSEQPERKPAGSEPSTGLDHAPGAPASAVPGAPLWLEDDAIGTVDDHLVSLLAPAAFGAEQYRAIRHIIEEQHKMGVLTVLAVSSPSLEDGKTTTAINLAGALAQAPEGRVLLIEADLRRPAVARYLGLDRPSPGLAGLILRPGTDLDSAVQVCAGFNLSVIPAGEAPTATYEVLKSPRLGEVFDQARRRYDYVIVDTPPLCPIPDGRVVVKCVDQVLLVVRAHRSPRRLVDEALDLLPAKPIAIVFNGAGRPSAPYYGGYRKEDRRRPWTKFVNRLSA